MEAAGDHEEGRATTRVIVNSSVELEGQARRGAVKVDDEAGDDLLATKLHPEEITVSKDLPCSRLGCRWGSPESPCERDLARIDVGVSDDWGRSCRTPHTDLSTA
jgi:hypothetical protein